MAIIKAIIRTGSGVLPAGGNIINPSPRSAAGKRLLKSPAIEQNELDIIRQVNSIKPDDSIAGRIMASADVHDLALILKEDHISYRAADILLHSGIPDVSAWFARLVRDTELYLEPEVSCEPRVFFPDWAREGLVHNGILLIVPEETEYGFRLISALEPGNARRPRLNPHIILPHPVDIVSDWELITSEAPEELLPDLPDDLPDE